MVLKFHMRFELNEQSAQHSTEKGERERESGIEERKKKLRREKKNSNKNKIFITKCEITSKADLQHKIHYLIYCLRLPREEIMLKMFLLWLSLSLSIPLSALCLFDGESKNHTTFIGIFK